MWKEWSEAHVQNTLWIHNVGRDEATGCGRDRDRRKLAGLKREGALRDEGKLFRGANSTEANRFRRHTNIRTH